MLNLFLQNDYGINEALVGGTTLGGLIAFILGFSLLLVIGLYVYFAIVWMTIAKKLNYDKPWLAWIPIANFFLFPILAGKRWVWGFLLFVPIVNYVFIIIWLWRIYELRGFPGALSLVYLGIFIPFINWFAAITNLVIMGVVAWGKDKKVVRKK